MCVLKLSCPGAMSSEDRVVGPCDRSASSNIPNSWIATLNQDFKSYLRLMRDNSVSQLAFTTICLRTTFKRAGLNLDISWLFAQWVFFACLRFTTKYVFLQKSLTTSNHFVCSKMDDFGVIVASFSDTSWQDPFIGSTSRIVAMSSC